VNVKKNKNILIIDDSVDNQNLLNLFFSSNGHNVQCASNGVEALQILNELSQLPDMILLDAQMPIMDGYQFRLEQCLVERLKNIPVIIMTGDDSGLLDERMMHPEGILIKPLQIASLIKSTSRYLQ
jgi:CheY-like chemotaxis protein